MADLSVKLDFGLSSANLDEKTRALWPHPFGLLYSVTLDRDALTTSLIVTNEGDKPIEVQVLLHTYLRVKVSCSNQQRHAERYDRLSNWPPCASSLSLSLSRTSTTSQSKVLKTHRTSTRSTMHPPRLRTLLRWLLTARRTVYTHPSVDPVHQSQCSRVDRRHLRLCVMAISTTLWSGTRGPRRPIQ